MLTAAPNDVDLPHWGKDIDVEHVDGVPYRMYTERPHRLEDVLVFAERWGDRPHLVQGHRTVTFGQLRKAVDRKAAQLAGHGVDRGDRVLVLGWNSPDWVVNVWACLRRGAVPMLANAWWSDTEIHDAVELLSPRLALADERGITKVPATCPVGPWPTTTDQRADAEPPELAPDRDEEDPAVIIFTSGTSGTPKAVELSHRALLANLQMLLHISRRMPSQLDQGSGEVALHTGPLFHVGGVQMLLRSVVVGNTIVMPAGRFDPGEVLELVERHGVTRWAAVPTMVTRVLDHPDVGVRDLSSLRALTIGGAPIHPELLARIQDTLPSVTTGVPTGYGLTENGGQATAASGRDTKQRPGSAGRPLPLAEVVIADGEVLVRSPTQMSGYLGEVESPIDDEGWLHTGDLGHLDEDGYLWITGRSKDLIIRGGENIAPAAVEQALTSLPGVREAAVIGVPHPDLGEEVAAFVVVSDDACTPETLDAEVRERIASFAVPTRWHVQREPLPTNHTGKVDKNALASRAGEE